VVELAADHRRAQRAHAGEGGGAGRLQATRGRMLRARHASPYFASREWVCSFERGLRQAWAAQRQRLLQPPQQQQRRERGVSVLCVVHVAWD
jgi:hypothetical protein